MFDLIGLFVLVVLIVLGAWLVKRAWGSRRKFLKWAGVLLALGMLSSALAVLQQDA